MRVAFAMADGHGEAITAATWFAPVLALGSSMFTAFVLWLTQRLVGKAAWETVVKEMNRDLIDQLQEERKEYMAERTVERLAWAAERQMYRGDILNLTQALESLKSYLRREGIHVPETAYHPADDFTILGEKKS